MCDYLIKFNLLLLMGGTISAISESCSRHLDIIPDKLVLTVSTGNSTTVTCIWNCTVDKTDNLKWEDPRRYTIHRDGSGTGDVFTDRNDREGLILYIKEVNAVTKGLYTCSTKYLGIFITKSIFIESVDPLRFIDAKENQSVILGEHSKLICAARGKNPIIYTWFREEEEIKNNDKYVMQSSKLLIKDVNETDSGIYLCKVNDITTGEVLSRQINVQVLIPPQIEKTDTRHTKLAGEALSLQCKSNGEPEPKYIWKRLRDQTNYDNELFLNGDGNGTVVFERLQPDDQGKYICTAYNDAGENNMEVYIEVWVPPKIEDLEDVVAHEGKPAQIMCIVSGRPTPIVNIYSQVPGLSEDLSISYLEKNTSDTIVASGLLFHQVKRSHDGLYMCKANSKAGETEKKIRLTVYFAPIIEESSNETIWSWNGKTVNMTCNVQSNPQAIITWLFQGKVLSKEEKYVYIQETNSSSSLTVLLAYKSLYGTYECVATNIIGSVSRYINVEEVARPEIVKYINVTSKTATSVLFEIRGPYIERGPPIVGYTAQYDEAINFNITHIHNNRTWSIDRPYRVDKLKPNSHYFFKFAAINDAGVGAWSELFIVDTPEKSVPESPSWLEQTNMPEPYSYTLKWKEPEDNGEPIEHYAIRYCAIDTDNGFDIDFWNCKEELVYNVTQFQLTNLLPNITYRVELHAQNIEGNSTIALKYFETSYEDQTSVLTASGIVGLSIVIVIICLLILDLLLLTWKRQGLIAAICLKKSKNNNKVIKQPKDRKGLLNDVDQRGTSKDNSSEFDQNKYTGIITGKHSSV